MRAEWVSRFSRCGYREAKTGDYTGTCARASHVRHVAPLNNFRAEDMQTGLKLPEAKEMVY